MTKKCFDSEGQGSKDMKIEHEYEYSPRKPEAQ